MPHIQQIKSKCFHNLFSAKAVWSVDQGQIQLISVFYQGLERSILPYDRGGSETGLFIQSTMVTVVNLLLLGLCFGH